MATTETMKYRRKDSKNWQGTFLAALAETGMVARAARRAGITEWTARRAKDTRKRKGADLREAQVFALAWEAALKENAEALETEAHRRAVEGVEMEKKIYYRGEQVGTETVRLYSDRLLIFLIQLRRNEVGGWRESDLGAAEKQASLIEATRAIADKRWAELLPMIAEVKAEMEAEEGVVDSTVTDAGPNEGSEGA